MLWASTGVKDPAYPDTLYVDELIGEHTVTTLPEATWKAFKEHGTVARTVDRHLDEAHRLVRELGQAGIDLERVGAQLQNEGIDLFVEAFDGAGRDRGREARAAARGRRELTWTSGCCRPGSTRPSPGASRRWRPTGTRQRLWEADPSLWKPEDEAHQEIIGNALGWLSVFEGVREQIEGLTEFVDELRAEGYRSAVLLGMGGSSLAPEVLREVLGVREGYLDLHVLDSTDPAAVLAVEAAVDLETTLFVVSSKSGGTTETASFHAYFYERLQELDGDHAGHHFVAITDEGTSLQQEALDQGFRAVFVNPSDIGGRYSALSFFGMVPAALIGVDLERLLDGVRATAVECGPDVPASENPALRLGAVLGEAALAGRDKLTIVAEPRLRALGAWVEQLVAESTGKEGRGILPVDLETARRRRRCTATTACSPRSASTSVAATGIAQQLMDLAAAGHPVHGHEMADEYGLGGEFLRWEIAVATAGPRARHRPLRPAQRAGEQGQHQAAARRLHRQRRAARGPAGGRGTPRLPGARRRAAGGARRVLRAGAAGRLRGAAGLRRPGRGRLGPPAGAAPAAARPACAWRPRSATARASCTPPASSTRAGRTRVCSCSSWGTTRRTWTSPASRTASACSSGRRRAVTWAPCGRTAAARSACASATTSSPGSSGSARWSRGRSHTDVTTPALARQTRRTRWT